MNDLQNLTGEQFEKYVYDIFIKLGFRTRITKATGDGGVDLIAEFDGLVFSGKYLIQCKRWKGKVGEPEIRDLYGTTISENALKGILITTSSFTQQAIDFSRGKNIELLDGNALKELVQSIEGNKFLIQPIHTKELIGFMNHPNFDDKSYNLLLDRTNKNPHMETPHIALIRMLMEQILNQGENARENGLIAECISRLKTYNEIFTKGRTNEEKEKRTQVMYFLAILEIAKGHYGNAIENLLDSEKAYGRRYTIYSNPQYYIQWERLYLTIFDVLEFQQAKNALFNDCLIRAKTSTLYDPDLNGNNFPISQMGLECLEIESGKLQIIDLKIVYPFEITASLGHEMKGRKILFSEFLRRFPYNENEKETHKEIIKSFGFVKTI